MLQQVAHPTGIVTLQSPLLAQTHVPHTFSTRLGGVSRAPFGTLNLDQSVDADSERPADDARRIASNYQMLLATFGCAAHLRAWVKQVHGREVVRVDAANVDEHPPADALITSCPGIVLSIRVADCVPVLIAACSGCAVAAVHAGWRGLIAGVIPAAVAAVLGECGGGPGDLVAAIGPCIGVDHFEVGPEVTQAFDEAGLGAVIVADGTGRPHVDLAAAAAAQLTDVGLAASAIDRTDCCVFRDAELFYSYRRDAGVTGRMAAVIAVRE